MSPRRLVVKIGSALLIDPERGLRRDWLDFAGGRPRRLPRARPGDHRRHLGRDRARPPRTRAQDANPQAGRKAGGRRGRSDQPRPRLPGEPRPLRPCDRPAPPDPGRHRGPPSLSERPGDDAGAPAARRRAGGQRERHRGDRRDPVRRQRSPLGAGRRHGERRGARSFCPTSTASTAPIRRAIRTLGGSRS